MTALKWWLRIVGALYLIEGLGLTAAAFFAPDTYATIWASTTEGTLDAISVRGILMAGLPGTLSWVLFGALMWLWSATPAKGRVLAILIAAWELLVWAPVDIVGVFNGFEIGRAMGLIAVHAAIGFSALLVLRRTPTQ
jgi:hypothetical protein